MEEVFYNILWIDDEHETLTGTKVRAKQYGINLKAFKSLNGGMDELERNYPFYDGVLLDAKFFENEDDVKKTESTYNVHRAKERLLQLKKKFEVFVLTGQAEAYKDKTFKEAFVKVYKKGSDEETDRLFSDIKKAADNQEDTQIRHSYKRVFDLCTDEILGNDQYSRILELAKHLEDKSHITGTKDKLTALRKVVERIFTKLNEIGVIPNEVIQHKGWITQCSVFLFHLHEDYEYPQKIIPAIIGENIHRLLNITQDGAHGDGTLRLKVDSYLESASSDYLYKSCIYLLFDILSWFGEFYIENKDKIEENKSRWKEKAWHIGHIIYIDDKNRGKFKCETIQDEISIPNWFVRDNNLKLGQQVKIRLNSDGKISKLETDI